jgi:thiol:disulfide interchange protein DsbC
MRIAMKKIVVAMLVVVAQFALSAMAAEAEKPEAMIKRAFETRPEIKVESVTPSEIAGLYAVQLKEGPLVYSSADGKYFVHGELYAVQEKAFVNLTEQRASGKRAKEIAAVKLKDMVVFKPQGATKAVIHVFTDVDCGYCRKLHKEVPKLNAMGIEVRYLAYPRAGIGSEDYQKMVTVWCAKDRQGAMTRFKNGEAVPINTCADNPVAAQYSLGDRLGVRGTPTMITATGDVIPGYVPATELAQQLGLQQ